MLGGVTEDRPKVESELSQILTDYPEGCDFLISAFAVAIGSSRKATVCSPFPSTCLRSQQGEKDYAGALALVQSLPPVSSLKCPPVLQTLSDEAIEFLRWLLLNEARPRRLALTSLHDVCAEVGPGCQAAMNASTPSLRPNMALKCLEQSSRVPASGSKLAMHGTSMENIHSIMHAGLQCASGTNLQRTGAIFGEGIYFSTEYSVAYSFSKPAVGWKNSLLGQKLRCLLVCEVHVCKEEAGGSNTEREKQQLGALPSNYLLVKRPDAIQLQYVLLYNDTDTIHGSKMRVNFCTILVVLYVAFLLYQGMLSSSYHRWF